MKPTSIFVSIQAFALAIALPAPHDENSHSFNLDLIRVELVGDPTYAISGCRKHTNACHFTNVIIFCDPATPVSLLKSMSGRRANVMADSAQAIMHSALFGLAKAMESGPIACEDGIGSLWAVGDR
ncbi:hypothetical protein B0O99DRAFT_596320 [Bisporella sp. PMI_857]|nr:hypothetical protein B0O99DRAFT_596320 [Bisporella sp. PMI_857]